MDTQQCIRAACPLLAMSKKYLQRLRDMINHINLEDNKLAVFGGFMER